MPFYLADHIGGWGGGHHAQWTRVGMSSCPVDHQVTRDNGHVSTIIIIFIVLVIENEPALDNPLGLLDPSDYHNYVSFQQCTGSL